MDQLSERNFHRLAELIQGHCGIRMPGAKRTMVEGRLRRRVAALAMPNLDAYCRYLFEDDGIRNEFGHLIDAVTTNKTDFFREPEHFAVLRDAVIPRLIEERPNGGDRLFKLWSAASSTGAEAYTMAMVLADMGLQRSGFRFAILGTDICSEVLETARLGVYPEDMMAPVPPPMRARYVMAARDRSRRVVRIVPELRRAAHFQQLNLMAPDYRVDRDVDVIFLRNVLIYFDKPTQQAVLTRLCRHLRPGGHLFLGHSESMAGVDLPLRQVALTVFRRE